MSSDPLAKQWDGWMKTLSKSYGTTVDLMQKEEVENAALEYGKSFSEGVKEIYSKAAITCPDKFSRFKEWPQWTRSLFLLNYKTEAAFREQKKHEMAQCLSDLRAHFYDLHVKTNTQASNDYIYAFYVELKNQNPDAEKLASILASLENAKLSVKAKMNREQDYKTAKSQWIEVAKGVLEDNTLESGEVQPLRDATETFYLDFGIQFE